MSQEIAKNKAKELSLSEANAELSQALQLIKKNTIKAPDGKYQLFSHREKIALGLASVTGFYSFLSGTAIMCLGGHGLSAGIFFIMTFSSLIPLSFTDWDGNSKNRFQTLLVKLFGTRKKKRELEKRQEEYQKYDQSMEIFKLYVTDIRNSLNEQGVFNVLNQHDSEQNHYLGDDGVYYVSKNETEDGTVMKLNDVRVDDMMKSLVSSPHIKEKLQIGLDK